MTVSRSQSTIFAGALIVALTAATATGALAQSGYYRPGPPVFDPDAGPFPFRGQYSNPYYRGRAFGAPAQFCQKLCVQDFAPCDPPEYKNADGRCTNPARRL